MLQFFFLKNLYLSGLSFMCCKWNIYRSTLIPKKLSSPEKFVVALMNNNKKICFSFFFWKICTCQVFPLCVVNEIFIVVPLFQKSSPAQKDLWLHSWTITKRIFASVFLTCWFLAYFMANPLINKTNKTTPPPSKKRLDPPAFEFLIFPSLPVLEPFNSL